MRLPAMICLALVAAACGGDDGGPGDPDAGVDPTAVVFDPARVATYALELPPASVEALTADPRTYVRATLRHGDEVVADIGVRLKGEYTFRPLGQKAAFKLKFDEFVADQTFHGLKRLTLNSALEDPSWVAERLAYLAFRDAGLPAPRAAAAWVTVNGEDYGLYVSLETEDKPMLRRWFADASGNLYEEGEVELEVGNEATFELETNETAADRSDLTALFAAIAAADDATLLADLAGVLDGPAFLRYCAYEAAVLQWDGYCHTRFGPNNFRLYHEPSAGQFYFLPWGMDMAWKPYEADAIDPLDARGMLLRRCLAGASCRDAYLAEVRAAADRLDALDLPAVVDAWGAQLRPLVDADPKKEVDLEAFERALAEVRARAVARPAELRAAAP